MPLEERDVHISQDTIPNVAAGGFQRVYQVRFWIGPHGPFFETFAPIDFNADAVAAAMKRVKLTIAALPATSPAA